MSLKNKINEFLKSKGINLSVEDAPKLELAATAKAADGSEIGTPTAFEVDAEIYVIVEGEPTAAPDGEIALEDGSTIVVAGGKIVEIKPKAEEMSSEVTEVLGQLAERISALENANTELSSQLVAEKANVAELNTKLSAVTAKADAAEKKVTELSKQPAATSVTDKKVELKKVEAAAPAKPYNMMTPAERVAYQREKLAQN